MVKTIRVTVRNLSPKTTWRVFCDECGQKHEPTGARAITLGGNEVLVCARCWLTLAA